MKNIICVLSVLGILLICCVPVTADVTLSLNVPSEINAGDDYFAYSHWQSDTNIVDAYTAFAIMDGSETYVDWNLHGCGFHNDHLIDCWWTGELGNHEDYVLTGTVKNTAPDGALITLCPSGRYIDEMRQNWIAESDCVVTKVNNKNINALEFPSALLPIIMIIGLLGTVLYVKRTKEI